MKVLQKEPGKDFLILNLTDPQLVDDQWQDGHNDRKIFEYTVNELVRRTSPDLITVSGDLSFAGHDHAYDMIASFLDRYDIPWAFVWGNHDNQGGTEYIKNLASRLMAHKNCIFEAGDGSLGNGNYLISIEENGVPVDAVIMLDSHDRLPYPENDGTTGERWAKLMPNQIIWLKNEVADLKSKGYNDAMIIMHIPIYAYNFASSAAFKKDIELNVITPEQSMGDDCWNEDFKDSVGVQHEPICSYPEDDGVFDAIKESEIIRTVVAGHDHINCSVIKYEGVRLVYGLKTGPGCYWEPALNGGTLIKINNSGVYDVKQEFVDISSFLV